DSMLVNLSGLEGHFMPIDLNIEHCIKFLKECSRYGGILLLNLKVIWLFFTGKGVYTTWDCLGDISATVDLLQNVQKQVGRAMGIAYHGSTHITPDTSASIRKVAYKLGELQLHIPCTEQANNTCVMPMVDVLASREQKLKSSTLVTFNCKVQAMILGEGFEADEDEIPRAAFDITHMDIMDEEQ
ncbi:hypothetical protein PAXRUDRAFT_151728, partial [Paxillus rubicundulus Ve08.2h10]